MKKKKTAIHRCTSKSHFKTVSAYMVRADNHWSIFDRNGFFFACVLFFLSLFLDCRMVVVWQLCLSVSFTINIHQSHTFETLDKIYVCCLSKNAAASSALFCCWCCTMCSVHVCLGMYSLFFCCCSVFCFVYRHLIYTFSLEFDANVKKKLNILSDVWHFN